MAQNYDQTYTFRGSDLSTWGERQPDGSTLGKKYTGGDRPSSVQYVLTAGGTVTQWTDSFGYDRDGNRTSRDRLYQGATTPTRLEEFGYDLEGRLSKLSCGGTETLEYDAQGALYARVKGTETVYYVGAGATVTVDALNTVKVEAHVTLGGARLATVGTGRVLYYHRDRQGSVVATTVARAGGRARAGHPRGELSVPPLRRAGPGRQRERGDRLGPRLHRRPAAHRGARVPRRAGVRPGGREVAAGGHGGCAAVRLRGAVWSRRE